MAPEVLTASLNRKRKRSQEPSLPDDLVKRLTSSESLRQYVFGEVQTPKPNLLQGRRSPSILEDEGDYVELVPASQLSSRRNSTSSSTHSDAKVEDDTVAVLPSTDLTPQPTGAASPVTSESSVANGDPINDVSKTAAIEEHDEEATQDVEQIVTHATEVEDAARTDEDDEVRPAGRRRWAGRRRATHPNPGIESAMRRQHELKAAFRSIARATKLALAELGQRTIDSLHEDPKHHLKVSESDAIKRELQNKKQERVARLNRQRELNLQQLKQTLNGERYGRQSNYINRIDRAREKVLDDLESEALRIIRNAQSKTADDDNETEDESGGVMPMPRRTDHRLNRHGSLDPALHSRSLTRLELRRAADAQARRMYMEDALDQAAIERPTETRRFAIMDPSVRDAAKAKRASINTTKTMADAARQIERATTRKSKRQQQPPRPEPDALEMQKLELLAEIASRKAHIEQQISMGPPSTPSRHASNAADLSPYPYNPAQYLAAAPKRRGTLQDHRSPGYDGRPDHPLPSPRYNVSQFSGSSIPALSDFDMRPTTATNTRAMEPSPAGPRLEPSVQFEERRPMVNPSSARPSSSARIAWISSPQRFADSDNAEREPGVASFYPPRDDLGYKDDGGGLSRKEAKQEYNKDQRRRRRRTNKAAAGNDGNRERDQSPSDYETSGPGDDAMEHKDFAETSGYPWLRDARPTSDRFQPLPPFRRDPVVPMTPNRPPAFSAPAMSDFDPARFRPAGDFNHRAYPAQPPFTPTAQPINHFGHQGIHRHSFSGVPVSGPPLNHPLQQPSWSTTAPSPLVGLPHLPPPPPSGPPMLPSHLPPPPPPSSHFNTPHPAYGQYAPMHPAAGNYPPPVPPPPPPLHQQQYGGQAIAPAGSQYGYVNPPPPAFAQQMGRHDQHGRRRNTEGGSPPFRPYNGPK